MKSILFTALMIFFAIGVNAQVDTFYYSGAMQSYIVPNGIGSVTIVVMGAQGGNATFGSTTGGLGGYVDITAGLGGGKTGGSISISAGAGTATSTGEISIKTEPVPANLTKSQYASINTELNPNNQNIFYEFLSSYNYTVANGLETLAITKRKNYRSNNSSLKKNHS